jgi:glutamate formiminotransferase
MEFERLWQLRRYVVLVFDNLTHTVGRIDLKTHIAARPRMIATDILVLMFICKFQTRNTGMIASVQSAQQDTAEYP